MADRLADMLSSGRPVSVAGIMEKMYTIGSTSNSSSSLIQRVCCETNSEKVKIVVIIYICTSFLSILGAGSILICSIWNRIINSPEVQPLFHLTLANFMLALTWFIGAVLWNNNHTSINCFYVDIFGEMFLIMSFFLTVNYGINVYIRLRERTYNLDNLNFSTVSTSTMYTWIFRGLYLASWLVPIVAVLPLVILHNRDLHNDKDEQLCSRCILLFDRPKLNHQNMGKALALYDSILLVVCLAPSMTILIFLYIMAVKIYRTALRRTGIHTDNQRRSMKTMRNRISLYVAVFVFCWIPALLIAIIDIVKKVRLPNDSQALHCYKTYIIQSLSAPLQGFLNSIVYGWTRRSFRRATRQRSHADDPPSVQNYGTMSPIMS